MRPPVLPSGNKRPALKAPGTRPSASMRPPVLPSGNAASGRTPSPDSGCFNEAAGFTQRKPEPGAEQPGLLGVASMRPPVLPSENDEHKYLFGAAFTSFNEAAGFTQRKHRTSRRSRCAGDCTLQ